MPLFAAVRVNIGSVLLFAGVRDHQTNHGYDLILDASIKIAHGPYTRAVNFERVAINNARLPTQCG